MDQNDLLIHESSKRPKPSYIISWFSILLPGQVNWFVITNKMKIILCSVMNLDAKC